MAAIAVVMTQETAELLRISVTVGRPYTFLTRDRATGTALFVGQVTEP